MALRARKTMGWSKRLSAKQVHCVYDVVTTTNPLQLTLPVVRWTRTAIGTIIAQRSDIKLSLVSLGRLLAQLGLTCQRWLFRASQEGARWSRAA